MTISVALGLVATDTMAAQAPDSLDSRTQVATRIAEAMDLQSRIDGYIEKATKDLPTEDRDKVRSLIKTHLHIAALRNMQIASMARTFTTRELNALEAFYRTETGRSIMSKYGVYISILQPALDAEIEREFAELKVDLEKENPEGDSLHLGDVPESTKIQHNKLLQLLKSTHGVEVEFINSQQHLTDKYGAIEVTNVYQSLDLSTIDGIHTARRRLLELSAKNDGFAAGLEKEWAELRTLVASNDLAEPEASGLRASLSADEAETIPNYRAWIAATRADVTAIGRLVDTAERHLGNSNGSKTDLSRPTSAPRTTSWRHNKRWQKRIGSTTAPVARH